MNSATENVGSSTEAQAPPEPIKYFFREQYAKLGVKGNFMPLAAQPTNVDLGETPIPVSAHQYISLVQRWMNGKVHDPKAFPTDPPNGNAATFASGGLSTPTGERPIPAGPTNLQAPTSTLAGRQWPGKDAGFPESFVHDVRTCFRQIFRIYAHLYHSHWIDPFWHLSGPNNNQGWTDLNSCFVHFCSVAKLYGLLSDKDAEPMQPLIDIWVANGSIPADAANGAHAIPLPQ
ncbi:hypothetical protein OEA41_007781 [Lepraria neglecta]|uniref:Mob1/phocein n=1 Tax=Lepraria neglecta TaxID=209136 RepID=A0AAE0DN92_9LECA|nr:hypothetical protein OEA41_007781 [Lepraria neglecta]